jgi:putative endonuclease
MTNGGWVYIMFNEKNGTLYVGVTSDLIRRVYEHKTKMIKGFTEKYGIDKLGYYERYNSIKDAIAREKQLKAGNRKQKIELIESSNPRWEDLYKSF